MDSLHHQNASFLSHPNNSRLGIHHLNGQLNFNNRLFLESSQFKHLEDEHADEFGEDDDVSNESVAE